MKRERRGGKNMDIDKILLAKEYANVPFVLLNTALFEKKPTSQMITYQTTHSAFVFPVSGRAKIYFDEEIFDAVPGKLIHGCAGKQLTFQIIGDEPFCHINLYYDPQIENHGVNYMGRTYEMPIIYFEQVMKYLKQMIELTKKPDFRSRFQLNFILQHLLNELFFKHTNEMETKEEELVRQITEYIGEHYPENITLKGLAEQFNKNPAQLSYLFYKHTNIRPIDYLIQYRIEQAVYFLREKEYSVKQTAIAVGYQDEFYFSRLFKKHTGIPPSHLKRKF